ncbi:MAG: hypothetical protein AAGJ80_17160, partial [Cyanobacteria bacterium J06553_1]
FLPLSTARELEMLVDYQGMILELCIRWLGLDAASRAGEHVEYSNVTVENYTDNVNHPPKLDLKAFKPNQRIQVFDRNGVCIGRIRNQRFEWKRFFLNTCLTIENDNESK